MHVRGHYQLLVAQKEKKGKPQDVLGANFAPQNGTPFLSLQNRGPLLKIFSSLTLAEKIANLNKLKLPF